MSPRQGKGSREVTRVQVRRKSNEQKMPVECMRRGRDAEEGNGTKTQGLSDNTKHKPKKVENEHENCSSMQCKVTQYRCENDATESCLGDEGVCISKEQSATEAQDGMRRVVEGKRREESTGRINRKNQQETSNKNKQQNKRSAVNTLPVRLRPRRLSSTHNRRQEKAQR